jgi:hypothetical protein
MKPDHRALSLPPEFRARFLDDRRQARQAAEAFARICEEGQADRLSDAALWLHHCTNGDAWRLAMVRVAKLPRVSPEIQDAFLSIWVESKMLPLAVSNRRVMADALRVLMPGNYSGPQLTLYRGASYNERRHCRYGFSWTTDAAVARKFAEHWARPELVAYTGKTVEGVVLQTLAPREAILLIRRPEDYYDEGEVVVDPFQLTKVEVGERLLTAQCETPKTGAG